jgi:hypothetical protein
VNIAGPALLSSPIIALIIVEVAAVVSAVKLGKLAKKV